MGVSAVTSPILGVDVTKTTTAQVYPLGTVFTGNNGTRYVFVKSTPALVAGDPVKITSGFLAIALTTTVSGAEPTAVGAAQIAFAAADYGWIPVSGVFNVSAATSCAQDVKLYTTASNAVDDDSSATDLIQGLKIITTITTAAVTPAYSVCIMTTNCQD